MAMVTVTLTLLADVDVGVDVCGHPSGPVCVCECDASVYPRLCAACHRDRGRCCLTPSTQGNRMLDVQESHWNEVLVELRTLCHLRLVVEEGRGGNIVLPTLTWVDLNKFRVPRTPPVSVE